MAAPAIRTWPDVPDFAERYQVVGFVDSPSERVVLKQGAESESWPQRVQRIELSSLQAQLPALDAQQLIRAKTVHRVGKPDSNVLAQAGVIPVWQPVVMPPTKHYGYAVQWALMALAVSIGAGIWWHKTQRKGHE